MEATPEDPVDAIAAAWKRELPDVPVHSIGIVTRVWHVAKLLGDDRARLLRDHHADTATLDLLSTLRRHGKPYRMTTRELAAASLITAGADYPTRGSGRSAGSGETNWPSRVTHRRRRTHRTWPGHGRRPRRHSPGARMSATRWPTEASARTARAHPQSAARSPFDSPGRRSAARACRALHPAWRVTVHRNGPEPLAPRTIRCAAGRSGYGTAAGRAAH